MKRTSGRAPSAQELDKAVDAYVREEVLNREARALGFDRDDSIVRQRLAQRMEFIATADVDARTPTDAELREFFQKNPAQVQAGGRHDAGFCRGQGRRAARVARRATAGGGGRSLRENARALHGGAGRIKRRRRKNEPLAENLFLLLALFTTARLAAHEMQPAFLELKQTGADEWQVLWKTPARADLQNGKISGCRRRRASRRSRCG